MSASLQIPTSAVKLILFQRTEYLRIPHAFLYKVVSKLLPVSCYNYVVGLESKYRATQVKQLYQQDMAKEFATIREFLPERPQAILDIGCGVAGIDAFLARHYDNNAIDFYLLDKSQVDDSVYYNFESRAAFYNSLDVAQSVLTSNGIDEQQIHLLEVTDDCRISIDTKLDLVISLISWGFHYPVSTYLERVHELLSDNGVLILDVRKDTGGLEELQGRFPHLQVILDTAKFQRVIARK